MRRSFSRTEQWYFEGLFCLLSFTFQEHANIRVVFRGFVLHPLLREYWAYPPGNFGLRKCHSYQKVPLNVRLEGRRIYLRMSFIVAGADKKYSRSKASLLVAKNKVPTISMTTIFVWRHDIRSNKSLLWWTIDLELWTEPDFNRYDACLSGANNTTLALQWLFLY